MTILNETSRLSSFENEDGIEPHLRRYAEEFTVAFLDNNRLEQLAQNIEDPHILFAAGEFIEHNPYGEAKTSTDLGYKRKELDFEGSMLQYCLKLAHEIRHGNPIVPLTDEKRAVAYGYLESGIALHKITMSDLREISSYVDASVIPNIQTGLNLKRIAYEKGLESNLPLEYTVRKRDDYKEAYERSLKRNTAIEDLIFKTTTPDVARSLGHILQRYSCIRPKMSTRTRGGISEYTVDEVINGIFIKLWEAIKDGDPIDRIAADQNDIIQKSLGIEPKIIAQSTNFSLSVDRFNGVVAPCVLPNILTAQRLFHYADQSSHS